MKINQLKAILTLIIILGASILSAQTENPPQNKLDLNINADFMSRYIWRGMDLGNNLPSIQPSTSITYKNLEVGAWGAYSLSGSNNAQEVDLYLNYTFVNELFTFILTDYYIAVDGGLNKYFQYKDQTNHLLEAGLSFNGTDKIPLTLSAYVNFYGNDAQSLGNNNTDIANFNKKIGIQYSNYFELGYTNKLKDIDYTFFMGLTLNNPKKEDKTTGFIGETGFYGTHAGIVNLGLNTSKELKITTNYSLPISTSIIINPQAEKVFLVFGLSF